MADSHFVFSMSPFWLELHTTEGARVKREGKLVIVATLIARKPPCATRNIEGVEHAYGQPTIPTARW